MIDMGGKCLPNNGLVRASSTPAAQPERSAGKAMSKMAMVFTLSLILAGCGLFDSGTPWKGGPYKLVWIDDPSAVTLSCDAGKGASIPRVEAQVYSVGYDGRYVVAKQHPNRDKRITNYFIVDAGKDSKMATNKDVVIGPLNEQEFQRKSKDLNLPPFTKTLESLK